MNYTACPRVSLDFTGRFLPPVYILVFIIGLVANGWGLKSLLHNWRKLKIINVFVFNLGLTDVLYLLTLPFLVVYYFMKSKWIFGEAICKITLFFTKTYRNNTEKCFDTTDNDHVEDYLKYTLGWTLPGFCIPLLITLGCYGHVIVVLCSTNTIDEVLKQRGLKLLFILILLFSVCFIPYQVFRNLDLWSRVLKKQGICHKWYNGVYIARQISRVLVCLNSTLNPLVYLHAHEDIPVQLRRLIQQARQAVMRPSAPPTQFSLVRIV